MFRGTAFAMGLALAPLPLSALELLMVEQPGCVYCARWKEEIGPIYPKTEVGAIAPIRMVWKDDGAPEGMRYSRPVVFTPTFILVGEAGTELGRLEGYPGEDFFWPLVENLVFSHSDAADGPLLD
ncbi:hypothetical protein [Mesobacterium pallidum]|uniref:hypothetical protein n=1 Tax=Mesobacterium pallidum TaxID=2872037 RepID=UPI001EE2F5E7|nr:hypothetical protein [Mesobacterium pallidum]